jgi:hypothetical protein
MRPTIPTTSITIQTTDGPCQVLAEVFGAWAVHRPSQTNGPGWHITHVASGTCIPDGYLEDSPHYMIVRVAKALDRKFPNIEPGPTELGEQIAEEIWRVLLGGKVE